MARNDTVGDAMARPRLTPVHRLAARLVTGPAAFLAAGVVDWVVLLARYAAARARGRRADWYVESDP
jgi:hypothetical protein